MVYNDQKASPVLASGLSVAHGALNVALECSDKQETLPLTISQSRIRAASWSFGF